MKKIIAMMLTCVMAFGLVACSGSAKAQWTKEDFVFANGSEELEVECDYAMIVYDNAAYYTDHLTGDYEEFDYEFVTSRGLELGMSIDDFKDLYSVKPGYAVWELYTGDENEYTSFDVYTNQSADEMYGEANNIWLDIGYTKVDGKWKLMQDYEIQDTWFCEADFDDYEEVVIFSVNLDQYGIIDGISLEYFTYDNDWVEWQAWE